MQAAQDTQRGAQAASRSVTTLQGELRDLKARQGGLAPHDELMECRLKECTCTFWPTAYSNILILR